MKLPKIYVSHRIVSKFCFAGLPFPATFKAENYANGCIGFLPVFSTKKTAMKDCKEISEGHPSGLIPEVKKKVILKCEK